MQKREILGKRKNILLCLLIGIFLFCGCMNQNEILQEVEPEYILTYAENHPSGYPTTDSAIKFAELVEERTNGKVRIQVKHSGEFGTQQQVVNQIKMGGVDFTRVSLSSLSDELSELNILQLPFLYEDSEHMWSVLNSPIGDYFLEIFDKIGLVAMSWYDGGARSFYSIEPIFSCEDINGKKIRVQESQMMRDMIALLGGTPIDLAYSEVYSAFETRKIDAAENNWSSYVFMTHNEVAKYYTLDEHTRVPEVQLASGQTWNSLPEKYQKIILECAKESATYEKQLWREAEADCRKEALEHGCQEIILSEEELEKFREKVTPLYEKYCSGYMEMIEKIADIKRK